MPAKRRSRVHHPGVAEARHVPTYGLDALAHAAALQSIVPSVDVYMLDQRIDSPESVFGLPYRSEYFGVGICLRGSACLNADLEETLLVSRSVLAMPPQTIKQWRWMSDDFEHIVVFFTKAFLKDGRAPDPDRFNCFQGGPHVVPLAEDMSSHIEALLRQMQRQFARVHPHRNDILRALLSVLLFELEPLGTQPTPMGKTREGRGSRLTADFKRLVRRHFAAEHDVGHYARELCVTPRHLSAVVRDHTGKTAGEWIHEIIVLEARVLLQDPTQTISQVAAALHFPDSSSFGKFFKNLTGRSPLAYRKELCAPPTF